MTELAVPVDAAPEEVRLPLDRAGFPVQRAKAQRPPLRPETLHRERLLDWLAVNIHNRLVLLVADPGYGKTTLLSDFADQTRLRTLWFRVDDEDRDWISVLHYLVAAGREADPAFASATAERLAELGTAGGTRDELVRTFLGELARLGDEPTVLIVDDYHVLDESSDARGVIADILVRAPERFTVVLATRRRPTLAIARLRALGEVAELTTDDLRFTEPETEALFRVAYHQPLEPDVLSDLARRTEGWAASLQLVRAAVRERSTLQIRAFVRALSGVDENLYDYLAEEVVGELDPAMQDFLMRTSILQVVDPPLAEVVAGIPQPDARRLIEAAERIGLLSRRGEIARHTVRYHPLVRDFLGDRLSRDIGDAAIRDLHRTVARHGESTDWRLAAYHYAEAGDIADLHRVVRASMIQLLGQGDIRLAHSYLTSHPPGGPDPVLEIIGSRIAFFENRLSQALDRAAWAYEHVAETGSPVRDAALFNLTSIQLELGLEADGLKNAELLESSASDRHLKAIARSIILSSESLGGPLSAAADHLDRMAEEQQRATQWHFLAVTLSNAAFLYRQMGRPRLALDRARRALEAFPSDSVSPAAASAESVAAWSLAAVGDLGAARALCERAVESAHMITRIESLVEAADVELWYGDADLAAQFLDRARGFTDAALRGRYIRITAAELAVRRGSFGDAERELRRKRADDSYSTAAQTARELYVNALRATRSNDPASAGAVEVALDHCSKRDANLFAGPLRLLEASILGPTAIDSAVLSDADTEVPSISMVAEIVSERLDQLGPRALALVESEAARRQARWAPALRNVVLSGSPAAPGAARLLDVVGEPRDIKMLRRFAKSRARGSSDSGLGRGLARRLAVKVHVEDLGRVAIRIGSRSLPGTDIRRRSLAMLCFLLTRPGWSATKEQVLDALWPDNDPLVAANSLNQTLYFLRRVFDPDYKEDFSAEYVHHEQDVLWLDQELLTSSSQTAKRLIDAVETDPTDDTIAALATTYRDRFALDFSYEEWASTFRDALHIRFLAVVEHAISVAANSGRIRRAIDLVRAALAVDPDADQLELLLIRLYRLAGSHLAASEQYEHYSATLRESLGVEPPPFDAI